MEEINIISRQTAIKVASFIIILLIIIFLRHYLSDDPNAVSLIYALVAFIIIIGVDLLLIALSKNSFINVCIDKLFKHRTHQSIRTYKDNRSAFKELLNEYSGKSIDELRLLSYTGDMGSRFLQRNIENANVTIHDLKILVKHPDTISEKITINKRVYPRFPNTKRNITLRKSEVPHSISSLERLRKSTRINKLEVRYYYSLPIIRAVIFNGKKGFVSIYDIHSAKKNDVSGTTNLYMKLSENPYVEKELLKQVMNIFDILWKFSISK